MKNKIITVLIIVMLLFSCKKEKNAIENQSIEGFYHLNGLEYITTVKNDSGTVLPFFVGKIANENKLKIVYSEKMNGINIFKSFILDKGERKEWTVNSDEKYYGFFKKPFLSLDGSFISYGKYCSVFENKQNQFLYPNKYSVLKFNQKFIGIIEIGDNSEIINNSSGNSLKILKILYNNDEKLNFNNEKIIKSKMWNYTIGEYSSSDIAFAYIIGDELYFSLLNSNFEETNIDNTIINSVHKIRVTGCDYDGFVGANIKIIKNKNNPFVFIGFKNKYINNYQLYEIKNNEIKLVQTDLKFKELFAYNNVLYSYTPNTLEKFDGKIWQKIVLPSNVNILNIYGSNEGIFLASRKKEELKQNYFDIVRLNP